MLGKVIFAASRFREKGKKREAKKALKTIESKMARYRANKKPAENGDNGQKTRFVSKLRPKPPPRRGCGGGSNLHTTP